MTDDQDQDQDQGLGPMLRMAESIRNEVIEKESQRMTEDLRRHAERTVKSPTRQRYESLRLAKWAIADAITAAGHIASRAVDCFERSDDAAAFEQVRIAIGKLAGGSEMQAINDLLHKTRSSL